MTVRLVLDGPCVTLYADELGLRGILDRLHVLERDGGHVHLTDLLDISPARSGRLTATDVDVVLTSHTPEPNRS